MAELLAGHVAVLLAALFMGLCALAAFEWARRNDQFSDIEEPKHRMLKND